MDNNNHHHHHHHKMDDASRFKRDSLNSIQRKKKLAKWGKRALIILAGIMALLVFIAYTIG